VYVMFWVKLDDLLDGYFGVLLLLFFLKKDH
jgi:hypothetical protein